MEKVDKILKDKKAGTDWELVMQEHLIQVGFFQHERLVHLLVTILFAVIAFLTLIMMTMQFSVPFLLLFIMILVLLVPYIRHYYLLENSVQKMYEMYDEIWKHVKEKQSEREE